MAIIDWPTTDAFRPTLPYSFGVSTPKSGARGFYTGENETVGHLSDRLLVTMNLPPCSSVDGALRSSLLMGAMSRGDRFRFGPPHARSSLGTATGAATVKTSVVAGSRSVVLTGVTGTNLLLGGSFEFDTNSDGLADGWTGVTTGSVSGATYARMTGLPDDGVYLQGVDATYTATGNTNVAGVERTVPLPNGPGPYTFLASVRGDTELTAYLVVEFRNVGGTVISTSAIVDQALTGTLVRVGGTATAPALTTQCTVRLTSYRTSGTTTRAARWDSCAVKAGATDLSWPGGATMRGGDFFSIGGNLLTCDYAGAMALDSGDMTVPLVLPIMRAAAPGALVALSSAVGVWQIDTSDGIEFDFAASVVQMGVNIPFRQVVI